jgi:hypothetical protein
MEVLQTSAFQPADERKSNRAKGERRESIHDDPPMAAQGQRAASNDPDLALVNAAWDRLPEAVKAGIVAMVKAASGGG